MGKADFYRIKKASIDNIEELITVSLILDSEYARRIQHKINLDHITSKHYKLISNWCLDYVAKYGKAPGRAIEEIYEVESHRLQEDLQDQVLSVLESLSDRYTDKTFNTEYIYNKSITYIDRQELLVRARNVIHYVEKDDIGNARNVIRGYNEIKQDVVSDGVFLNPENFYKVKEGLGDGIFKLSGSMGKLIGDLHRGWFGAFLAPMKKGKTFFLCDWAIEGFLQGLKVVLFSLEMRDQDIDRRLFTALAAEPIEPCTLLIPQFDCKKNQNGTCNRKERRSSVALYEPDDDGNGEKPDFDEADTSYQVCNECRKDKELKRFYHPESWFEEVKFKGITWDDVRPDRRKGRLKVYNEKNFRRFCPPIGTVPFSYIEETLIDLELTDGFVPDLVVVDYADLIESNLKEYRHKIDDIWKKHARLAVEKDCLVLTASQSNKEGFNTRSLHEGSAAEDVRKNAHVTVMLGINQSKKLQEREKGLLRVNLLFHRYKEIISAECLTTQHLGISRVCIDDMLVTFAGDSYEYIGG